jgi:DNA repair protein RadC
MANSVKKWPSSERPRERLLNQGAEALSDAELLAIILRSGLPGKDVIVLARELLAQFGGLRGLLSSEQRQLQGIKGLGQAKVTTLIAITEIAKRCLRQDLAVGNFLRDPAAVVEYLSLDLRDQKIEVLKVIFLDKSNRVLGEERLAEGTGDRAIVDVRAVMRRAVEKGAASIVLAHNHPAGTVEPSKEDRILTTQLAAMGKTLSVNLTDHIIIGDNSYYSFKEHGDL